MNFANIGPPYLELNFTMKNKQEGSYFEAVCTPSGGNPNALSSSYSYLLCFKPILSVNFSSKIFHLAGCPDECCPLLSSRKVTKQLEYVHRGDYWCRVEHDSKDLKLARNSTVRQLDVECKSFIYKIVL